MNFPEELWAKILSLFLRIRTSLLMEVKCTNIHKCGPTIQINFNSFVGMGIWGWRTFCLVGDEPPFRY